MAQRIPFLKKQFRFLSLHKKTIFLFGVGSFFFLFGALLLWASLIPLPDFATFKDRKVVESTKIYDRTGKVLLYDVHQDVQRTVVPLDQIPVYLQNATIAVEDANFYSHIGVDPKAILRAILANIFSGSFKQGFSTITQQVVKKTLLTDEKLLTRKFKEIVLAIKLERSFSKKEILALYLNEIPYGGNIYGLGQASRVFFGKEPKDLTLAESAYLVAIPNAPTYYSPYGNHRDKLDERKNFVLKRMHDLGYLDDVTYTQTQAEKVSFLPKETVGIKAPHFVEWIKEYLADKYGEQAVQENGYKVTTTLDYALQQKAENTISTFGPDVEKNFNAKNMGLVAVNPKNGQVLAMVGSRDYFDVQNQGNFNVAISPNRQPGSTFKPFVYATAFMRGYTPETVLFDLPTNFSTNCDARGKPLSPNIKPEDCYMPENFDGKYRGPVSMRSAIAMSLNIPSVKTLYLAGISNSLETAKRMGITSLGPASQYGLTLVLGGGEVSLLELTGGYGVFANDGVRNPTTPILRIEDKNGNVVEEFKDASQEVIPSEIARKITNILSDNEARTPEFGATSALYFPNNDVAVKTGTTNDYRDVWTVGYTPNIAVGMWAGNNDNSPMKKNIAGFIITPVWHAFMQEALKLTPQERFIPPQTEDLTLLPAPLAGVWQGGEKYVVDTMSGKLATANTPVETKKVVVVPEVHSILYWIDKNNPRGPRPQSPQIDPQFNLWEQPVRAWAAAQNIREGDRSGIPTTYDTEHTAEAAPVLVVSGLDFTQTHKTTDPLTAAITSTGKYPLSRVDFYINGQLVDKKTVSPFVFTFTPSDLSYVSTSNTVSFVAYDSILNKAVFTSQLFVE
jgi:penicillin-binding protein 1C